MIGGDELIQRESLSALRCVTHIPRIGGSSETRGRILCSKPFDKIRENEVGLIYGVTLNEEVVKGWRRVGICHFCNLLSKEWSLSERTKQFWNAKSWWGKGIYVFSTQRTSPTYSHHENVQSSDSDFCTYQLCSFSSAQQPQDNITMEVLIFIFANGFNLQMNDLIFKSAMLQKTHQGILYCFWLTSSRAHWDVTFLGFGFSLQMDALIS